MANPIPAGFLNFPIVDTKTGRASIDFLRFLQNLITQTVNLNLDGSINGGSGGNIDPSVLAAQVANLDANGVVLPNGIDLSRAYINKFIGYIPDGNGRFSVTAVDGSNKALIDFSQVGHTNKNLDNVGDGTTYNRISGHAEDALVHQGTSAGPNSNDYRQIATSSYSIVSGDHLEYDVWIASGVAANHFAIDFRYGALNFRDSGITDQNGLSCHPSTDLSAWAAGKWYHRVFDLTTLAGNSITSWASAFDNYPAGSAVGRAANITITNGGVFQFTPWQSAAIGGTLIGLPVWSFGASTGFSNVLTYVASAAPAGIDTFHVVSGAVNVQVAGSNTAAGVTTTETAILTLSLTPNGGWCEVFAGGRYTQGTTGGIGCNIRIRVGSISGAIIFEEAVAPSAGGELGGFGAVGLDATANGTYVITATLSGTSVSNSLSLYAMAANRKK